MPPFHAIISKFIVAGHNRSYNRRNQRETYLLYKKRRCLEEECCTYLHCCCLAFCYRHIICFHVDLKLFCAAKTFENLKAISWMMKHNWKSLYSIWKTYLCTHHGWNVQMNAFHLRKTHLLDNFVFDFKTLKPLNRSAASWYNRFNTFYPVYSMKSFCHKPGNCRVDEKK